MGMRNLSRVLALLGLFLTCVWGVAGTALASPSTGGAAFAVSDSDNETEYGTITVSSNPAGATFTISGAASYSGTAPWSTNSAPLGTYTISWGANATGTSPTTQSLTPGDLSIAFTASYSAPPQVGTISVTADAPGATFNLTGPADYSGVPRTISNAPPGHYTITWNAVMGYTTPASVSQTLTAGGTIIFTGTYTKETPQVGTISVTADAPGATFNLTGPADYSGVPRTISNAPPGHYTITWNAVMGYTTPASVSQTLTAGGTIIFTGTYTKETPQDGTISVSSNPAGATFTITGTAAYSGTTPATFPNALPGNYAITWDPMPGFNTPPGETKTLSIGGGISFTGNYAAVPLTGAISVTANMPGATFTITGAAQYKGTAPATYADAPTGNYTITWGALAGMQVPAPQTLTLEGGDTITFKGTYVDNVPPIISAVTAKEITTTSAIITWTTNEPADSRVEYGLAAALGFTTPLDSKMVTTHSVTITGLNPGTWYYYRVNSRDLAGNPAQSKIFELLTSDDIPPVISSVIVTDISDSGASVKWETDERSDSQVEYGLTANYGSVSVVDSALLHNHSVALAGLSTQTTYHFRVKSTDYWGNSSLSPDATFTTTDIDAPVISGVAATAITDTSVIVVWFTDSQSQSIVEYGLTTNYGMISTFDNTMTTGHSVTLVDLVAQTTYHYKVKSRDASGLWAQSSDYTFTTGIDMGTDPPKILFLTSGEPTSTAATISWSTDEMALTQVEYGLKVEDDRYQFATPPGTEFKTLHSVQLTGLKSGVTYHYRVICTDAAGNRSVSQDKTFVTPIGRAPLPSLPPWAWAIVGVAGVLVVGVLVVKNR